MSTFRYHLHLEINHCESLTQKHALRTLMTKIIKLISAFTVTLLLSISFSSFSATFEEGKHYKIVAKNKTTTPELSEYFSYYCPALIIAEKTDIDREFSSALFNYLQTDRATIDNEKDIRNIFVLSGGDGKKFDQGMKNFSVIGQAKREKKVQDELSANNHLTSVPAMVVNGKYLINSKSLDRNNFFAEYSELVAYLFTL